MRTYPTAHSWCDTAAVAATILLLIPLLAVAQDTTEGEPPTLETTVSPSLINVGDPVSVILTVTHAPDAELVWPDPVAIDPFELVDAQPPEATREGNHVRSRLELTITAFELGELSLPGLDVQIVGAAGDPVTLSTDIATVTVESVGRDDGGGLRDIKGPLAIPFSVLTLLPWLTALGVTAGLALWLYRRYRRRSRPTTAAPVAPPRPAHLVACESLDALEASGLLDLGEIKTYHIRLSDIMRVYVEGRFGLDAMEMTTSEVLAALRRSGASSAVVADFRQLLDRCNLVKFAKSRPTIPACRDLVPLGRRLVDTTAPPAPAASDTPAEAQVA